MDFNSILLRVASVLLLLALVANAQIANRAYYNPRASSIIARISQAKKGFIVPHRARVARAKAGFNVLDYGADRSGKKDSSKAFSQAWDAACEGQGWTQFKIPKGKFLVGPMVFSGRKCTATSITVHLNGKVLGDVNLQKYIDKTNRDGKTRIRAVLHFQYLDRLIIKGHGTIDGQGHEAWTPEKKEKYGGWNSKNDTLPSNLELSFVSNTFVQGITSVNSKAFHFKVFKSSKVNIQNVTAVAPDESPNTDGIHISSVKELLIANSRFMSGDDCVSILGDSAAIVVENVLCGPGHGISVGSLGQNNHEGDVRDLHVKDCIINGTMNGVRIKTWPNDPKNHSTELSLSVKRLIFENIQMINVTNPIIIDQEYCPNAKCNKGNPSTIHISGIKFKNITGTSFTSEVVKLLCSKIFPCGVELENIDLKFVGNGLKQETTNCTSVTGTSRNVKALPLMCKKQLNWSN